MGWVELARSGTRHRPRRGPSSISTTTRQLADGTVCMRLAGKLGWAFAGGQQWGAVDDAVKGRARRLGEGILGRPRCLRLHRAARGEDQGGSCTVLCRCTNEQGRPGVWDPERKKRLLCWLAAAD